MIDTAEDSTIAVHAAGVLWAIEIDADAEDLDWLDHALLEVATAPRRIADLLLVFRPLPRRLMEDALGRLLERNLLLLDVAHGSVRRSGVPAERRRLPYAAETMLVWQDYATGQLIPWHQIKPWVSAVIPPHARHLKRGFNYRTPLQMSDAELLHNLERFRPTARPTDSVRARNRLDAKSITVRGIVRSDGRLAVRDQIPAMLRLRWARLAGMDLDFDPGLLLPSKWEHLVGSWAEASIGYLTSSHEEPDRRPDDVLYTRVKQVCEAVRANASAKYVEDARATLKSMVREAEHRIIVAVSGRRAALGDALQLLGERMRNVQGVLIADGLVLQQKHKQRVEDLQIEIFALPLSNAGGLDCVLIDDRVLVFGGMGGNQEAGFILRSQAPLTGILSWLYSLGVSDSGDFSGAGQDVVERIEALRSELLEFAGARSRSLARTESQQASAGQMQVEGDWADALERLTIKVRTTEYQLRERSCPPLSWLSALEVEALLSQPDASGRCIVGKSVAEAFSAIVHSSAECMLWREGDGPAEMVVKGDTLMFGCWRGRDGPAFIAFHDAELASLMRLMSDELEQCATAPV